MKSHDSPVPTNLSPDGWGGWERRAPNTACSVSWITRRQGQSRPAHARYREESRKPYKNRFCQFYQLYKCTLHLGAGGEAELPGGALDAGREVAIQ